MPLLSASKNRCLEGTVRPQPLEHPMEPTAHSENSCLCGAASSAVPHWFFGATVLFPSSSTAHKSTGRKNQGSSFPDSENTAFYIGFIIFQALLREFLQEAQLPSRDICHAPGDCGNWSLAVFKEIWVLRIKKSQSKSYQCGEYYDLLLFHVLVCYYPTLQATVEGIFLIKVIVSSRSKVLGQAKNLSNPLYCVAEYRSQGRMLINTYKNSLNYSGHKQFVTQGHPELQVTPLCIW